MNLSNQDRYILKSLSDLTIINNANQSGGSQNVRDIYAPLIQSDQKQFFSDRIREIGEYQSGYRERGVILGEAGLIDGGNYWTVKPSLSPGRYYNTGLTFSNDVGMSSGGGNATAFYSNFMYTNSMSTWTSKADNKYLKYGGAGHSLTSDYGIVSSGYNGVYFDDSQGYFRSLNVWTFKSLPSTKKMTSTYAICLTNDLSIVVGGINGGAYFGNTDKFINSGNIWISRTAPSNPTYRGSNSIITLNTDYGNSIGGRDAGTTTYNYNDRFADSLNAWSSKTGLSIVKCSQVSFSFSSNYGLSAGGHNIAGWVASSELYEDGLNTWSSRTGAYVGAGGSMSLSSAVGFLANGSSDTTSYSETCQTYTNSSFGAEINNWGTCIDSNLLKPSTSEGYWSMRSIISFPRCYVAVYNIDSNNILTCGGKNSATPTIDKVEKFTGDTNIWVNKTAMNYVRSYHSGFSLTSDLGMEAGGFDASAPKNTSSQRSETTSIWTSKGTLARAKGGMSSFNLTSAYGICAGGTNVSYLNDVDRYDDAGGTWSARTNTAYMDYMAGVRISSDTGITMGGHNADYLCNINKYYNGYNCWVAKNPLSYKRAFSAGFNYKSGGMMSGGENGVAISSSIYFDDITNSYSNKSALILAISCFSGSNIGSDTGITVGGSNGSEYYPYTCLFRPLTNYVSLPSCLDSNNFISQLTYWSAKSSIGVSEYHPFSFTYPGTNLGIVSCGYNLSSILQTTKSYDSSTDAWTSRDNTGSTKWRGAGFGLTTTAGVIAGGATNTRSTTPTSETQKFSNYVWSTVTAMPASRGRVKGFPLNTTQGIVAGGYNGTDADNDTYRYEDGGSWTTRTGVLTQRLCDQAMFGLTSTTGMIATGSAGGTNYKNAELYDDGGTGTWTVKNGINNWAVYSAEGTPISTNLGLVTGGNNGTECNKCELYNVSGNYWSFREYTPLVHSSAGTILTNLVAGYREGTTVHDNNFKYNIGELYAPKVEIPPISVYTIKLREQKDPIYNVFGKISYTKDKNTPEPTFGISGDDGKTWIDNLSCDKVQKIENLRPSIVSSGYWGLKNSQLQLKNNTTIVSLYKGYNIMAGGHNASYLNTTEAFNNSINVWTGRTVITGPNRCGLGGAFINTDKAIFAGGENAGATYQQSSYRYTNSSNVWDARDNLGVVRYYAVGLNSTSDLSYLVLGNTTYTNYNQRHSDSAGTWTAYGGASPAVCTYGAEHVTGISLQPNILVCGGRNGSDVISFARRYDVGTDAWATMLTIIGAWGISSISLNRTSGIISGGGTNISGTTFTTRCSKWNDISRTWSSQIQEDFIRNNGGGEGTDGFGIISGGNNATSYCALTNSYNETNDTLYQIKAKFNLNSDYESDVWISRSQLISARSYGAVMSLTSDSCVYAAGNNGTSATILAISDKFNNSTNVWNARTPIQSQVRTLPGSFSFTSDIGVVFGGSYSSGNYTDYTDRYTDSANYWVSRTAFGTPKQGVSGITFTSDVGVYGGGYYSGPTYSNDTERFTDSTNTWTVLSAGSLTSRYASCPNSWSSNTGFLSGGSNGAVRSYTDVFTNSSSTWSATTSLPAVKSHSAGISLDIFNSMNCGGTNGANINNVDCFNSNVALWTSKQGMTTLLNGHIGASLTQNTGLSIGGNNGASEVSTVFQYKGGNTKFYSFYLNDFNGAKLI